MKFQSTLPARGATPEVIDQLEKLYISIHAPRTGSDGNAATADATRRTFQSTLPARGATAGVRQSSRRACDFNPRSPHGERRHGGANRERGKTIFQSTLPARGATGRVNRIALMVEFQSTLPARGATVLRVLVFLAEYISIHAPRTGSDVFHNCIIIHVLQISIHAPRTGSDAFPCLAARAYSNFNPRSPHGERRPLGREKIPLHADFNPRSPHGERPTELPA